MKKAQLFQQPIFYIFVLIVAALFLVWGIKTIFDLKETAELAELATSIQSLKKVVNSYYSFDSGSARIIDISLPVKIKYICFTNNNPQNIPEALKQYGDLEKLFRFTKENSFIFPQASFTKNAFIIEHLTAKQDPLCLQTNGRLKALITNIGTSVEISKNI